MTPPLPPPSHTHLPTRRYLECHKGPGTPVDLPLSIITTDVRPPTGIDQIISAEDILRCVASGFGV